MKTFLISASEHMPCELDWALSWASDTVTLLEPRFIDFFVLAEHGTEGVFRLRACVVSLWRDKPCVSRGQFFFEIRIIPEQGGFPELRRLANISCPSNFSVVGRGWVDCFSSTVSQRGFVTIEDERNGLSTILEPLEGLILPIRSTGSLTVLSRALVDPNVPISREVLPCLTLSCLSQNKDITISPDGLPQWVVALFKSVDCWG